MMYLEHFFFENGPFSYPLFGLLYVPLLQPGKAIEPTDLYDAEADPDETRKTPILPDVWDEDEYQAYLEHRR